MSQFIARFKAPAGHTISIRFLYNNYMMKCPIESSARHELELTLGITDTNPDYKLTSITECR